MPFKEDVHVSMKVRLGGVFHIAMPWYMFRACSILRLQTDKKIFNIWSEDENLIIQLISSLSIHCVRNIINSFKTWLQSKKSKSNHTPQKKRKEKKEKKKFEKKIAFCLSSCFRVSDWFKYDSGLLRLVFKGNRICFSCWFNQNFMSNLVCMWTFSVRTSKL